MSRPNLTEIRSYVERTFSTEWDDTLQSSQRATFLELIDLVIRVKDAPSQAHQDEYGFAKRRIDVARVVELIEVITAEGEGVSGDPVRLVSRFYQPHDGRFVALGLRTGIEP